jgi:hypothetical protein
VVKKHIKRAGEEVEETVSEIRKQMLVFITGAFGFVAALMWRDAIVAWLEQISLPQDSASMLTLSALVVTVIAVFCIVILTKIIRPKTKEKK